MEEYKEKLLELLHLNMHYPQLCAQNFIVVLCGPFNQSTRHIYQSPLIHDITNLTPLFSLRENVHQFETGSLQEQM